MAKTVKMWNSNFETVLTDIPGLRFLDFDEEKPEVRANTLEVKGKDGVLIGTPSYAPFQLILRFYYAGSDVEDYNLLKQKLRSILFRKDVFYVHHSDRPGIKYACYTEDNSITDIYDRYGTFEVTFNVYKGYSESLKSTVNIDFLTDDFQFEQGVITGENIKYEHTTPRFRIWNGGEDIDPLDHRLVIKITCDAPNGIFLTNHMTNETFRYYGAISKSNPLILNGVHPIMNGNRVGIDSNWEWITLVSGFNHIEIDGIGMNFVSCEFEFDFIYR